MASRDLCQDVERRTVAVYTTQIFILKQNPRQRLMIFAFPADSSQISLWIDGGFLFFTLFATGIGMVQPAKSCAIC